MSFNHHKEINSKSLLTINLHPRQTTASLFRWKTSGYSETHASVEPMPYASKRFSVQRIY